LEKPKTRPALRVLTAAGVFAVTFGLWMALVVRLGLFARLQVPFFVNKYDKPPEFYWPLISLWWSFHGGLWVDRILIPLAGCWWWAGRALAWRSKRWGRKPAAGPGLWSLHPGRGRLHPFHDLSRTIRSRATLPWWPSSASLCWHWELKRFLAGALWLRPGRREWPAGPWLRSAVAVGFNGCADLNYAAHPEYTFVNASSSSLNT
jgi:hypothetical protein